MAVLPQGGVYTPVPTFFKKDCKTIDFEAQIGHAKFLQKNGITGITLLGSTGENAHLTRAERVQLVSEIYKNVPGFPIVAGVAQNSLAEAIEEISQLKAAGASFALVLPSCYFGAGITQQGLVDWYTEVADAAPIPVLLYVYPGVCNNVTLTPDTIKALSKHSNIVGIKFSHGDFAAYGQVSLDKDITDFVCLTGLGQMLLPALSIGFQGTVDAISGAFPKIYSRLIKAYKEGDLATAERLQHTIIKGENVIKHGVIGIKRTVVEASGFGETYLGRAPLNKDTTEGKWDEFAESLAEIAAVEKSL